MCGRCVRRADSTIQNRLPGSPKPKSEIIVTRHLDLCDDVEDANTFLAIVHKSCSQI